MDKRIPKYREIASSIKKDIENGLYHQGDKLPVERILCDQYKVSRMTVRHALQYLESENIIHINPSRGAFVNDLIIKRSKEILSFTELMTRQGFQCRSKVIRMEKVKPDAKLQEIFGIGSDDEVYELFRIRYANDEVAAIEYAHINGKFFDGLEMFNFEKFSLYDILHEHYNVNVSYSKDDIRADYIYGEDAKTILGQKIGPALIVYDTGYDQNHVPIEYTKTIYNYKLFTYSVISTETSRRYE